MKEKKDNSFWNVNKRNIIIFIFIIIFIGTFSLINAPKNPIREDPYVAFNEDQQKQKNLVYSYNELLLELESGVKQGTIKIVSIKFVPEKISYEFSWHNDAQKVFVLKSLAEEYWLPLFSEYKINIVTNDTHQGGGAGYIIWIILILFSLFFMMRRGQSGMTNPLGGFGKAPAKLFQEGATKITFADVAGCDEAKKEIQEIVEFIINPQRFTKIGGKIPKGILLLGPPGTGKTLLAKAIAGEAGVPFYSISGSGFVEMFIGVGASRVRNLFEEAKKNAPAIIFIDEIESVGGKRGGPSFSNHNESEQTLNQLLAELDGFEENSGIILVGASNQPDSIDEALMRPGRFDRQVVLGLPDLKGRKEILKVHAKTRIFSSEANLEIIAQRTPGFSGADLANIINEAALLAGRENKEKIEMIDLEEAIDKITMGFKQLSKKMTEKEKRIVSCHEAGHTLIAELLPCATKVHKVSIIPRGIGSLGQTMMLPEEKYLMTASEIKDNISAMLGGRIAEKIIFNETTSGAANDLEKATEFAKLFVCKFGMDETMGHRSYGTAQKNFIGPDWTKSDHSEEKSREIDEAIDKLLAESYQKAQETIKANLELLKILAEELFTKETLERENLDRILEHK
ncbi:MAG: ATP-dependent zinc metalloprotease FtsH [Patescibacteria group bacterium]|mgnify:CR=1 FL=1